MLIFHMILCGSDACQSVCECEFGFVFISVCGHLCICLRFTATLILINLSLRLFSLLLCWELYGSRSERPLSLIRDGPPRAVAVTVHKPFAIAQRAGDLEADMTDSSTNSPGHRGLRRSHARRQTQTANLFLP